MAGKKGNSLLETRRRNRVLIKNMIFRMDNATRTAIAEELGLTLPTITTSVNEMLAEGILEENPIAEGQLSNNMGRRPNAISFKADAAYAIGVELAQYATRAVLINLKGEVISELNEDAARENYDEMLIKVTTIIQKMIEQAKGKHLLGVGVGLPGFIESEHGIIRSNPRKDWIGKNFAKDLEERLHLPVLIDNNVRLRAVGHEMSMKGIRPDSFAYFYVSKGIACPLMIKDGVVSGYTAGAGEIGHTIISVNDDGGRTQMCLDDLGSEKAVFEKCQEAMLSGKLPALQEMVRQDGRLRMHHIIELQQGGNEKIQQILEDAIEYLGIGLANVVNLINPGYVVVDGFMFVEEANRQKLLQSAKEKFFGLNEEEVQIIFEEFDYSRGAVGAGYFVIRNQFLNN